jgi:hypothetical protein
VSSRFLASYPHFSVAVPIDLVAGCFLRRSPLSVDPATRPPPAVASKEIATPAPEPSSRKRTCGEETGRAEDVRRSPRLKLVTGDTGAEDSARPEVPVGAAHHLVASPEASPTPAEEAAPAGADLSPPPAADDAAAGDVAAICISPDSPSRGSMREAAAGETEGTSVPATEALSNLELVPGVIAEPPLLEPAFGSGGASPGLLATRVARSERGDGSPAPGVVTKGTFGGKALVAAAESHIGSLSSASRLQQEWADTASSADVGGKLKVQGSKPTLAELDKQFTAARGSLHNAGLQLLDAIQTTNVSAAPLALTPAIHPSPRVSR